MGQVVPGPNLFPRLDLVRMRSGVDLEALVRATCGEPRGGRYSCPFAAHGRHNLAIYDGRDGTRWRCHACGRGGTVFDWMIQVHRAANVVEAARMLGLLDEGRPAAIRHVDLPPPPPRREVWRDPAWQAEAGRFIHVAHEALWGSTEGEAALGWLGRRGLSDSTIRRHMLGFVPDKYWSARLAVLADVGGEPGSFFAPRGITFPWLAPGSRWHPAGRESGDAGPALAGVNIRRLARNVDSPITDRLGKCRSIKGSAPGHGYPRPQIDPERGNPPALIVEGEIDALLSEQTFGHAAFVTTAGGAGQKPRPSLIAALEVCHRWLLATDNDDSGRRAANMWRNLNANRSRPCHRLLLPDGVKDLGELIVRGMDPVGWMDDQLAEIDGRDGP